jgi:ethanolamine ammonia-lyase large subunit
VLTRVLADALAAHKLRAGRPMLVRYGRVKIAEHIAEAVQAELVVLLIGERPGGDAEAARSLSAYLVFRPDASSDATAPSVASPRYEYTVISNVHSGGLPAWEAGGVIAEKIVQILAFRAAGNRLEALLGASSGPNVSS